jgi:hypothetical protein
LTDARSMEEEEEVRRSPAIEEEVCRMPAMEEEEVRRPWRRRRCIGHGGGGGGVLAMEACRGPLADAEGPTE